MAGASDEYCKGGNLLQSFLNSALCMDNMPCGAYSLEWGPTLMKASMYPVGQKRLTADNFIWNSQIKIAAVIGVTMKEVHMS